MDIYLYINLLSDFRAVPFAFVCVSLGWQLILLVVYELPSLVKPKRSDKRSEDGIAKSSPLGSAEKVKGHVAYFGGYTVVGFMLARLLGSAFLLFFVMEDRFLYLRLE